ncbi:hypothetical protein [Nocardioides flavescens]|uniref:Uncharacterized protein n=1 Tax=Nocardioides flavescens TaxID=2691959 RepID=A0A6L7EZX6_9ACTN|nr:hypothetical protein [Nocardioides flavescens]MXG89989.1 hypothetical protein [Nocardioides flavescens]
MRTPRLTAVVLSALAALVLGGGTASAAPAPPAPDDSWVAVAQPVQAQSDDDDDDDYGDECEADDDDCVDVGDDELWTFDAYRPTISGKVQVGQVVTVVPDEEAYSYETTEEVVTLTYRWLVDGKAVGKGSGTAFKLKKKHRGRMLSVEVTASAPTYETETVISKPRKILG